MKKLLITTLILLMLTLTACGSASDSPTVDSVTSADFLPPATQLIVGTMKLDGTEQDVTAGQAAELLPLWQVYSELLTSDTAAQGEIDGLIAQIRGTMTDEQMQAIEDMALTQQDVMAAMQEQGLGMGGGQGLSAGQIATAQASRSSSGGGFTPPDGGMPMGAPPDGGEGIPGDMQMAADSSSGSDSSQTAAGRGLAGSGVPSVLIEVLIELLKSKAGS
ncbi:MAG: hypothetical protein HZB19_15985 [Chloroflexi bacterium]|nr:hypothetical protein [Chloroflexota bacterium]